MNNLFKTCFVVAAIAFSMPAFSVGEIRGSTIPAAMCAPSGDDGQKVILGTTGWSLRSGVTGSAGIFCPLPHNAGGETFSNFRVYYRDPDGVGLVSGVRTWFKNQNATGGNFYASFFDSNTVTAVDSTSFRAEFRPRPPGALLSTTLYGFYITISRTSATAPSPVLAGFDFVTQLI